MADRPTDPTDPEGGSDRLPAPASDAEPDVDLGGLGGPEGFGGFGAGGADTPGGFDMGSLLNSAMQMQQELLASQQRAAETAVEGQAGGGAVRIEITGGLDVRSVTIAPEAVDPDDVELLQDLVLAAMRDALARAAELGQGAMPDLGALGGLLGGGGLPDLGSLDLGGIFGGGTIDAEWSDEDDDDDGIEPLDDETDDAPGDDDDGAGGPPAGGRTT